MARRALIVIDVQHEYLDGALPISDPPLDTSLANIGRAIPVYALLVLAVIDIPAGDHPPLLVAQ